MDGPRWKSYPVSHRPPEFLPDLVRIFSEVWPSLNSEGNGLVSNDALALLAPGLARLGFRVETGKSLDEKVSIPVLFGENGKVIKSFNADAYFEEAGIVLEVEAGQAVDNHRFLKDLFQACVMQGVDHLVIAVQTHYGKRNRDDYRTVERFFDTLYQSGRLQLPLDSLVIVGY